MPLKIKRYLVSDTLIYFDVRASRSNCSMNFGRFTLPRNSEVLATGGLEYKEWMLPESLSNRYILNENVKPIL